MTSGNDTKKQMTVAEMLEALDKVDIKFDIKSNDVVLNSTDVVHLRIFEHHTIDHLEIAPVLYQRRRFQEAIDTFNENKATKITIEDIKELPVFIHLYDRTSKRTNYGSLKDLIPLLVEMESC